MSYGGYQQYGGNPYEAQGGNPYEQSSGNPYSQQSGANPYGQTSASGSGNPYGQTSSSAANIEDRRDEAYYVGEPSHGVEQHSHLNQAQGASSHSATPGITPAATNTHGRQQQQPSSRAAPVSQNMGGAAAPYPDQTQANMTNAPSTILSNQDFLQRVESIRASIRTLTTNVSEIGMLHQRALSSPQTSQTQLDNLTTQTQILNTTIKDQIKYLEMDAAKSGKNTTKDSQIRTLKGQFKNQLEDYQKEETTYRKRYQEQIAREYRIVNPEASESEVMEASTADWGNEGVFQTALKSNRTGAATSTLSTVRARHNDIQQITATLIELNALFEDLATQVVLQEPAVTTAEDGTAGVLKDTEKGNQQLDTGIKHAKSRRKLKWICLAIVVAIIVILALVLGLYFGLRKNNKGPVPLPRF